ncbi:MAG: acetyl-CoA carboxylase biotin carboxyl carrier protein [Legionella sp.]|jgi:acetyl-CoA carboxylase biotin carboxyl carrier protein|nr:acetyl-CoA carboxylase biotin carboxyl carrier protein [Legionella sp.]
MDIRKIKKLIELLNETGISEIEIKEGEESLRLTRHLSTSAPQHTQHIIAPVQHHAESTAVTPSEPAQSSSVPSGHAVLSPMVGTFYAASSPEKPPFASIGQSVSVGDTLCIIEAMKMFNEVEADRSGVIKAILFKNGDPIEYGDRLFIIE